MRLLTAIFKSMNVFHKNNYSNRTCFNKKHSAEIEHIMKKYKIIEKQGSSNLKSEVSHVFFLSQSIGAGSRQ